MRHRVVTGRKSFARSHSHKDALLRNMVFALIEHGRIKTTLAKAKELRRHVERVITLGKRGGLNARRLLFAKYPNKKLIADVFNRLVPKFLERQGGYTRIVKVGPRAGDNASMAFIEWVEPELIVEKTKVKAEKSKAAKKTQKQSPEAVSKSEVKEPTQPTTPDEKAKPRRWFGFLSRLTPRSKGFLVVIALILALLLVAFFMWSRTSIENNEATPNQDALSLLEERGALDFSLPDVRDGRLVVLSQFKGQITIVNFWATWCSPCVEEFESMLQLLDQFQGQIKIIAISMDKDKKDILNFLKAFEVASPHLMVVQDADGELAKEWGTLKLPESYILNREQKLIKKVASAENWSSPVVFHFFNDIVKASRS